MSRFTLIGDSNVQRFVTLVNRRACPDLDEAQVLTCGRLALLQQVLSEIEQESDVCVVACLTNFLTAATGSTSASVRVESILLEVQRLVVSSCIEFPSRKFLICPPMYRSSPLWYRDGLSSILGKFSSVLASDRPENLLLMSSFPTPSFEPDGVHLTPVSGLEYIYFLFDTAKDAIKKSTMELPEVSLVNAESARVIEDRVMALEQDHHRLNRAFEHSAAVSAEREDFQENVRNEVFFMISGLPQIKDLRGKDWMDRAIKDVQGIIKILLDKELKVQVVHNASGRAAGSEVRYSVRMEYAADSQEIRSKFGSFFIGGQDRRPDALRSISISNNITPGTQIRLMILKLMARRYSTQNPDAKVKVIGYESRPMLKITLSESDRRTKNYTFIEAVSKLPTCFTASELRPIVAKARTHFKNALRSTFIVLSDDFRFEQAPTASDVDDPGVPDDNEAADADPVPSGQPRSSGTRKRTAPDSGRSAPGSQRARI